MHRNELLKTSIVLHKKPHEEELRNRAGTQYRKQAKKIDVYQE